MPIRRLGHAVIFTLLLAWPAAPLCADAQVRTDANLITALDASDSMMRHEERLEFEGLARAIVHLAVLDAIAGGRYGPDRLCRVHMVERRSLRGARALDPDRIARRR
jgi:Protein of unknown function (DUF1194)